ncbi:iron-containing alcohol dehydrogenase [Cellulosimicrobium composti]|uniref:iron-containing alcohol dehydrogenase n=1 Tax=Cellulosimicrobium composti TaxID=2672572 RepID=UPI00379E2719
MTTTPSEATALPAAFRALPLQDVVSAPGALDALPDVLRRLDARRVTVLHDGARIVHDGRDVVATVLRLATSPRAGTTFVDDTLVRRTAHGVVLDEDTVDAATIGCQGYDVVVATGGGTVTDLAKAVVATTGARLVVVQCAASVNGYSDALSVLVRNGAKRTAPTAWPAALLVDHDVLAAAPPHLTRSGVGDAAATWTAPADWYLAGAFGMDSGYDPEVFRPVQEAVARLRAHPAGSPEALSALVDALTVGGLSIGVCGTTAPLSGSEHLMSHLLDMAAMARDEPHDLHGAQVGVATVVAASLWQVALDRLDRAALETAVLSPPTDLRERVTATWAVVDPSGRVGAECWTAVERKLALWTERQDAARDAVDAWDEHRATLRGLTADPAVPADVLRAWGAPTRFSELTPAVGEDEVRWVLRSLPLMRDRFTLPDLLLLAGLWDDALLDEVLALAARHGGGL